MLTREYSGFQGVHALGLKSKKKMIETPKMRITGQSMFIDNAEESMMRLSKTVFVALVAAACLSVNAVGQMSISGSGIVFPDGSTQSTAVPVFVNVYRVPADGTPVENGNALRSFMSTITSSGPTLVELDAGTYDLGSASFTPSADDNSSFFIKGQGRDLTVITGSSGFGTMSLGEFEENASRVMGLMDLSVVNNHSSAKPDSSVILVGQGKSLFERCRFIASGAQEQIVVAQGDFLGNTASWDITMRDCSISNTTNPSNPITGIRFSDGKLTMDRCEILISNASSSIDLGIDLSENVEFFMSNSRISVDDSGLYLDHDVTGDPVGISVIGCIFEGMSSFALDMAGKQNIRFMNSYIQGLRLNSTSAWFASCYSWPTLSPITDNTPP